MSSSRLARRQLEELNLQQTLAHGNARGIATVLFYSADQEDGTKIPTYISVVARKLLMNFAADRDAQTVAKLLGKFVGRYEAAQARAEELEGEFKIPTYESAQIRNYAEHLRSVTRSIALAFAEKNEVDQVFNLLGEFITRVRSLELRAEELEKKSGSPTQESEQFRRSAKNLRDLLQTVGEAFDKAHRSTEQKIEQADKKVA